MDSDDRIKEIERKLEIVIAKLELMNEKIEVLSAIRRYIPSPAPRPEIKKRSDIPRPTWPSRTIR